MPSRAHVRWAKFRAVAVSLVAILIMGVLVYLMTRGTLLEENASIYIFIPDATGLGPDSPVRVDGISLGKVERIELSGSNQPGRVVKVTMSVRLKDLMRMSDDSDAQLSTESLIGDKFVDIATGKSPGRLRPGAEVIYREQSDMLKTFDMQQLEKNLRTVDEMLTGIEQGTSRVGKFVQGEGMYRDFLRQIAELERGLQQAVSTTSKVGEALYRDELIRRISEPLVALDRSLARLQSGQGSGGQFLRDPAQYEKLRNDTKSLGQTFAKLRSQEFFQSDRHYSEWSATFDSITRKVDEFNANPLFGPPAQFDNLNGMAKELRDTLKDFRENPRKYMRLKVF